MPTQHPLKPLVERQRRTLNRYLRPTVDGEVEPLHQCRVATRRLRELLVLCAGEPVGRLARRARTRAGRLGRTLGAVRELDVALELVDELAQSGRAGPAAAGRVRQRVTEEHERQRRRLRVRLNDAMRRKTTRAIADAAKALGALDADTRWASALARRMNRRASRLDEALDEAGPLYVSERVHAVRIAAKKLRYVLEIANDTGGVDGAGAVSRLKRVQQRLGRLHDLEVLQTLMRSIELPSARHEMWVGQLQTLDDDIEAECRRLHSHFVAAAPSLRQVCVDAREFAAELVQRAGVDTVPGRTLKMSLDGPRRRKAVRSR